MAEEAKDRLTQLLQTVALLGQSLTEEEFVAFKQAIFDELGVEVKAAPELSIV